MIESVLAGRVDLSILQPQALSQDIHRVSTEVLRGGYAGIVVPPLWVGRVAQMFRADSSRASVTATVSFPHGTSKPTVKAIEATSCVKDGADALMVVPQLHALLRADADATKNELLEIVRAARAARRDVLIHVVIDARLLVSLGAERGDHALSAACRAVREGACDGVVLCGAVDGAASTNAEAIRAVRGQADSLAVIAMASSGPAQGGPGENTSPASLITAGADRVVVAG